MPNNDQQKPEQPQKSIQTRMNELGETVDNVMTKLSIITFSGKDASKSADAMIKDIVAIIRDLESENRTLKIENTQLKNPKPVVPAQTTTEKPSQ